MSYEYSLDIRMNSPLHKRIVDAMNARYSFSSQRMTHLHEKWRRAEDLTMAYIPEKAVDAVRRNKRENEGKPQYTTIVLPYTYAQLMGAHSYWTTVFLARDPIFQFSGRHGESEQQTQAMEALIAYQMQTGQNLVPIYFWLYDAGRFGLGVMGDYWAQDVHSVSRYMEVPDIVMGMDMGQTKKELVSEIRRGYHGNKLFNIRPYDYFPDTRKPIWNCQAGEFVAYHNEVGWHDLVKQKASGAFVNVDEFKQLRKGTAWTGRMPGSPNVELPNDDTSALTYESLDLSDTGPYGILTMEIDLIPSQWGLSKVNTSEKWIFTGGVTSSGAPTQGKASTIGVVLEARPLGCEHNKFRVNCIEMEPEPYGLGARSLPQIIEPLQNTMDWLVNSHMYAVRKTMNNMFVVDPSRVVMADFTSNNQNGGAIRARPAAYGTDLRNAVSQLQVQDLTKGNMGDMAFFDQFAQRASGINEQMMGQVRAGGRMTAQQVRADTSFGLGRQKTTSEYYSMMGFYPLAERLVQNSQQYYDAPMKLRLVGDLINQAGPQFAMVNPADISGAFDFVPVDGNLPIDRFQMASLWQQLFGQIMRVPQVAMQYDLGKVFAWVAQLAGLKNIYKFKIQVAPPGVDPRQAGGNVVPISEAMRDTTRTPEPGQIPGNGSTG